MDRSHLILKNKNIIKSIIILALPVMFSNILKSIHDLVDVYFIGNVNAGEEVITSMTSAITLTNPIIQIFQALALGLMIAGTALMSQYIGAGKADIAKKVSGQLLFSCIIIGIFFNIMLYFLTPTIMLWMGAEKGTLSYQYAVEYIQIRSFEMTGLFVFFAFQATRQSRGDTLTPVILNVISVILNIILTWLMVSVLNWHIVGAALATVIANMVIIPPCIILMVKTHDHQMKLELPDMKPEWKISKKIFVLGMPAALSQAFTSLGFLIINGMVWKFSEPIKSGIGVGGRINSLLLFPAMAIGSVLATFIGQNIGANNIKRARDGFKNAMIINVVLVGVGAFILMFLREDITRIFIKNSDEAVQHCVSYLYFLLIGLPLMSIFQVYVGAFQGAGRTGLSLIFSSIRLWVLRIPVIIIFLRLGLEERSFWYAMAISNFGAAILGCILYTFMDYQPRISRINKRLKEEVTA